MTLSREPAVWFPTVHTGTGTDVFTERLVAGLRKRGIRAEITWLPLRAEYAPLTVSVPSSPAWANIVHVNTWLAQRFIPDHLIVVATMHHCVHDPLFRRYQSLAQIIYHRVHILPIERRALRRSTAITAVSRYTAARTQVTFGTTNIKIIYPGVDPNGIFRPLRPHAVHHPFRLLFAGTGIRRKGVDLLVPIMNKLGPDFQLDVVGTNNIGREALPVNVHVRGRLCDTYALAESYQGADALLFPSRLEGFGQVIAEAMACGLPVIATRGSSLVEVVDHGVTGLLCTQDDVAAFASAARTLAADDNLRANMRQEGIRRVARLFSVDRMVGAYLNLYSTCLNSPR